MSTWSETMIARAISLQTLQRKCVVLVPNCSWTGHECDVLAVTTDLRVIDVEVKISRADLKADARKDKWWHRPMGGHYEPDPAGGKRWVWDAAAPREWPPKVWKHYYAMPKDLWDEALFACLPSPRSGVLLLEQRPSASVPVLVKCERRAAPNRDATRLTAAQALDVARLANLRMWSAYS
jgi:hypothetical protein